MTSSDFEHPLTRAIAIFLGQIGLDIRAGAVPDETALPGIDIDHGVLVVDEARLAYPGDLLHEAGHLAVAAPDQRASFHHDVGNDGGEEMGAIAWSYAAALHLEIDPALVFHAAGYRGGGASILENFAAGKYFGVPYLAWCGMTNHTGRAARADMAPFPAMQKWLRDA
ncbi:MAG: hypothetical protein WDM91_09345 [Rhizomicrobium sp.]